MDTLTDLRKYILTEYGIPPHYYDDEQLRYRAITFKRNVTSGVGFYDPGDLWLVQRQGGTDDYMRTQELQMQIAPGGALLYWFFPEGA
jgi:hypothetical protein